MIFFILGTRPEIVKMAPIIRLCERNSISYSILHTGQHYNYEMDMAFFKDLHLPLPKYNLEVGSGTHAIQTAKIMTGIEGILIEEKPDIILVQGDTNTVLGSSLAASKIHIKIGHIEAGLRSFDRRMPEEINRIISDQLSDLLFAPTKRAYNQLITEGISEKKIFLTGNTIVDSVFQNLEISKAKSNILNHLNLVKSGFFLTTIHRAENVDEIANLREIINGLKRLQIFYKNPIIFPIHPRTRKMIETYNIDISGIDVIEPLGFLDFIQLEANARLILTDSGGVQEEGCILGVPCVTIRENTERQETIEVGSNILSGISSDEILKCSLEMVDKPNIWKNPFGDGDASSKIIDIITDFINQ